MQHVAGQAARQPLGRPSASLCAIYITFALCQVPGPLALLVRAGGLGRLNGCGKRPPGGGTGR
eukprot:10388140-Heterocapsa_arctica.AAC.1